MNDSLTPHGDAVASEYAFRVRGRLSPDVVAALHPLLPDDPVTETVLRGDVPDQAALHGLIARLEQLGVELVELLRLPGEVPTRHASRETALPRTPLHGG